jgi:hypothetical protein
MKSPATALSRLSCGIAAVFAITAGALAREAKCDAPFARAAGAAPSDYRSVFRLCRNEANQTRLAIRRMTIGKTAAMLAVDPASLATSLEDEACWTCADTTDEAQKDTRYLRAVEKSAAAPVSPRRAYLRNAGLVHGAGDGTFITGDLCPSNKPLDRPFIEKLAQLGPKTPVALSISGLWLTHHSADFEWLRERAKAGALDITWVNHSFHHPFVPGVPFDQTFLLTPGVDAQAEITETERLLIARGETPSVFFRFPGLISNAALMDVARALRLVTLGADAWLVLSPPPRPGGVALVHPNGNEPLGLRLFSRLVDSGGLPRPFRAINEAPEPAPAVEATPQLPPRAESSIKDGWLTRQSAPILRK